MSATAFEDQQVPSAHLRQQADAAAVRLRAALSPADPARARALLARQRNALRARLPDEADLRRHRAARRRRSARFRSTSRRLTGRPAPTGAAAQTPAPEQDEQARLELEAKLQSRVLENFRSLVLAGIALILLMPILGFAHDYIVNYVLGRIELEMKLDICGKLLALPLRFHRGTPARRRAGARDGRRGPRAAGARAALRRLRSRRSLMIVIGAAALFFISVAADAGDAARGPADRRRDRRLRPAHPQERAPAPGASRPT